MIWFHVTACGIRESKQKRQHDIPPNRPVHNSGSASVKGPSSVQGCVREFIYASERDLYGNECYDLLDAIFDGSTHKLHALVETAAFTEYTHAYTPTFTFINPISRHMRRNTSHRHILKVHSHIDPVTDKAIANLKQGHCIMKFAVQEENGLRAAKKHISFVFRFQVK